MIANLLRLILVIFLIWVAVTVVWNVPALGFLAAFVYMALQVERMP